jgi:hypothetical protein
MLAIGLLQTTDFEQNWARKKKGKEISSSKFT